jgi:hypothetical protein
VRVKLARLMQRRNGRKPITCIAALTLLIAACSGSRSHPAAKGVDGVSAAAFAQRGIYLGPPGTIPAGVPNTPPQTPATTFVTGVSRTSIPEPSAEQLAVRGDPANGTATVTAQQAVATATKNIGGFVGPVTVGSPQLVQLDSVYARVVATAWAVPVSGTIDLSHGPVSHGPVPTAPTSVPQSPARTTTAIVFVDATTGNFISEEGFGSGS